ncbi:MAG TPA: GNAT family N-acetyltransferase [Chitinophagaceae bacterium]|jgi:hypothetical protein|nr:GNAT family N-acetyltransferase [Chitinophagaceae bacterium]
MSPYYEAIQEEYRVSTDPALLDIDMVHHYLSNQSYWAANIPRETVMKSIANSLCFGLYWQNKQIGFARLVTDRATFAYLADVFIIEERRKKGLAKWLIGVIQSPPSYRTCVAGCWGQAMHMACMNSLAGPCWMRIPVNVLCKGIIRTYTNSC